MMTNLRELAKAAKAAHEGGDLGAFSDAFGELQRAATPAAISALYAELDEARMRADPDLIEWAALVRESKARAEAAEASLSEKEREVERLRAELRVEREITGNLSWAGEQNNRTVAALRWELGLAVANLEAAASAYRTYAKRHLSIVPKATTDAAFTTRVADFDKAVERARAALTQEPTNAN